MRDSHAPSLPFSSHQSSVKLELQIEPRTWRRLSRLSRLYRTLANQGSKAWPARAARPCSGKTLRETGGPCVYVW